MRGLFWTSSLLVLFTASCVTASCDTECDRNMSLRFAARLPPFRTVWFRGGKNRYNKSDLNCWKAWGEESARIQEVRLTCRPPVQLLIMAKRLRPEIIFTCWDIYIYIKDLNFVLCMAVWLLSMEGMKCQLHLSFKKRWLEPPLTLSMSCWLPLVF